MTKDQTRDGGSDRTAAVGGASRSLARTRPEKKQVVVKKEKTNRLEQVRKYFRGVYNELKKVHWPNRREITIYTAVVLVAVLIVGALIWIFDSILSRILQLIIK